MTLAHNVHTTLRLFTAFLERTPVDLVYKDEVVTGWINAIEKEDGSGTSFNLEVTTYPERKKRKMYFRCAA